MMLTADLIEWSRLRLPGERFEPGPDTPKFPGRMVVWTPTAGGGLTTEFLFDQPSFQARSVGPQSRDGRANASLGAAEALAYAVDRMVLTAPWPASVGGVRVVRAQRFGSGPTPLAPDASGRVHFVCTYMFEAASGY